MKDITIQPVGNMSVCTKFNGNPYNCSGVVSLKTTNMNLMVALKRNVRALPN